MESTRGDDGAFVDFGCVYATADPQAWIDADGQHCSPVRHNQSQPRSQSDCAQSTLNDGADVHFQGIFPPKFEGLTDNLTIVPAGVRHRWMMTGLDFSREFLQSCSHRAKVVLWCSSATR